MEHGAFTREQATPTVSAKSPSEGAVLSKNAAKKLAKRQKLEATKLDRRAAERLKKKANKRAKYLERQTDPLNPSTEANGSASRSDKRNANSTDKSGASAKQKSVFDAKLVIDCGFDDLMNDKELSSFGQQLMYLYSANRYAQRPFAEVIFAGSGAASCITYLSEDQHDAIPLASKGKVLESKAEAIQESIHNSRVGQAMNGKLRGVWKRWKGVTIYEKGGLERLIRTQNTSTSHELDTISTHRDESISVREDKQAAGRINAKNVVYLTADTENILTGLEEGTTYVIGGIVDKNRYKALCKKKAEHIGVRLAKLPLTPENLDAVEYKLTDRGDSCTGTYRGRKVLTVNQVVEILLGWTETGDWVEALHKSLPQRKYKKQDTDDPQ